METTAVNKLPFPDDEDPPNGDGQIAGLAAALDVVEWGSQNLKPVTGIVAGTFLALNGGYVDVPSAVLEITPAVPSKLRVVTAVDLLLFSSESNRVTADVALKVDAEAETIATAKAMIDDQGAGNSSEWRGTVSQVYEFALTAAKHTLKLRGKATLPAEKGSASIQTARFSYELFAA